VVFGGNGGRDEDGDDLVIPTVAFPTAAHGWTRGGDGGALVVAEAALQAAAS